MIDLKPRFDRMPASAVVATCLAMHHRERPCLVGAGRHAVLSTHPDGRRVLGFREQHVDDDLPTASSLS